VKTALTIAGSDSIGGAGIQADIKTMAVHNIYAMSVITALTAQNTTGVYAVHEAPCDFVGRQLDCVFTDISPDAVKIGMVSNIDIIGIIADKLLQYQACNIVLDPVMVSASGGKLLNDNAIGTIIERLFPAADIITPNIPEAETLCGFEIEGHDDMLSAAKKISGMQKGAVLIKGGHLTSGGADDLLFIDGKPVWINGERVENPNTHGTGCTLSSAIACNLAMGYDIIKSVKRAKDYVSGALKTGLDLGKGSGPLNHSYLI